MVIVAVLAGLVGGFFLNSAMIGYGLAHYADAVKALLEKGNQR